MSYRLTQEQLNELRRFVEADDIGGIESLLDAIYQHRRRLEREAQESIRRQHRRAVPWLPVCER
jgi:hypothetical protein